MKPCTIVIKLVVQTTGTSSIVHEETHQPLLSTLSSVVETVVQLRKHGHKVVLVSSGAIGVGLRRMNIASRPKNLSGKQALAAIGQGRLIALYDELFGHLEQPIAQVLLTRGDISDRTRYLNAVNTLNELLSMGVVPIVNENDTISVSEIKFGDNDTLSAITSSMIHADYLFLLTDVDGLYTANPRKDPSAKQIEVVTSISAIRSQVSTTTMGSSLGTGGMETKIIAAEIATGAGVTTIITSSKRPENMFSILEYHTTLKDPPTPESKSQTRNEPRARPPHTVFMPSLTPMRDLKAWTSHTLFPAGTVVIDAGAHRVLSRRQSGGRLLAAGLFASGQAVRIVIRVSEDAAQSSRAPSPSPLSALLASESLSRSMSEDAATDAPLTSEQFNDDEVIEVGRGLAMYNYAQISRVRGMNSSCLTQILGYADSEYVVENITIRVPPRG
ncbi:Aspartate/glutamate/uridylate kinase [Rhodocollybia butyracea]|uniref:Aspartate/glutamate/uridylate kinase n=1 Tax=Rhodocollybia butyracea TaxID=206335 RepID=A0A9P5PKH7_9AGAR|nr:Aspartate/glutamate/uridylate kinase [Rhodocollybia butyracea]